MVELASKCKQLTTLNLGGHTITVAAVVAVAREAPQLESLGLNSCYNITDVAVVAVSLRCTQLSSLDLRCCSKTTDLAVVAVGGLEVQAAHDARSTWVSAPTSPTRRWWRWPRANFSRRST